MDIKYSAGNMKNTDLTQGYPKFSLVIYIFYQHLHHGRYMTLSQLLNKVSWFEFSFPSPRQVAKPRLENPVFLII